MDRAIEIKRRAQRCVQSGDLAGALAEYEKLAQAEDADPYTHVLIADLHFKRGDSTEAGESYLLAVDAYEKASLYKNAIAICKKMIRLTLSPPRVLQKLAQLHALDGLRTEAALYYMQYAEHLVREEKYREAVATLKTAVDACPDNVPTLEKLAEAQILTGDEDGAAASFAEAARRWAATGLASEASRAHARAEDLRPGITALPNAPSADHDSDGGSRVPDTPPEITPAPSLAVDASGIETGRHDAPGAAPHDVPEGFESHGRSHAAGWSNASTEGLETGSRFATSTPVDAAEHFETNGHRADEIATDADDAGGPPEVTVADIEGMLHDAERQLHAGERDVAAATLLRAAQSYEAIGRYDHAGTIYQSLARSPHGPGEALTLWLANCERRGDHASAAEAASQLGERALTSGDAATARTWFERARSLDPSHALSGRRLERMDQMAAGAPAPPRPEASETGRVAVAIGRAHAVSFDLAAMLEQFQRAVGEQLSGDAQSHYDLGMTYREMGLLPQAVESFRVAAADPAYATRCTEMIGRCLLDQGDFDAAIHEFETALDAAPPADAALNLHYHLGLACEAAGRTQEALAHFEQVAAAHGDDPDVAARIRTLRRALENV